MLGCVIGVSDAAARETEGLGSGVDIRIGLMMDSIFWFDRNCGRPFRFWVGFMFLCVMMMFGSAVWFLVCAILDCNSS